MFSRTIHQKIKESLLAFPVTVVTGARQVGKSTEVYTFVKSHNFHYVSLDNIDQRKLAQSDPRYFIELHGYPLIIDEVQYAPEVLEIIEEIVNLKRLHQENANGLFLLTGSQTFQLMQNVAQSMAGRAAILRMEPFSRHELTNTSEKPFLPREELMKQKNVQPYSIKDLYEQIILGFYPELYNNEYLTSSDFYARYVTTYIERDIHQILNIKDTGRFHDFMQILASLTGQQLNITQLSRLIGISTSTVRDWLSVLEASGLIYYLQSYHDISITKRVVKSPKVYFADTGLAAYLAKLNDAATLEASAFAGAFMETYVMNEIRKSFINNGLEFNGTYYRDSNQNEIDLVLLENATLHLVEIKKGMSFNLSAVKAFKQLKSSVYTIGDSCILCNTQENYALSKGIYVLSASCI